MKITNSPNQRNFHTLARAYGSDMHKFEQLCFNIIRNLCDKYSGGCWTVAQAENGAVFMFPPQDMHLTNPDNYSSESLSAQAVGLVVSALSLNAMCHSTGNGSMVEHWGKVMEVIYQHNESAKMLRILD